MQIAGIGDFAVQDWAFLDGAGLATLVPKSLFATSHGKLLHPAGAQRGGVFVCEFCESRR
jgi:hypothetical protein